MTERARYDCCDLKRRNAVAQHPVLNGLDALEIIDRDLPSADPLRQRTLLLFCLKPIANAGLSRDNVRILGGERVRDPQVEWVAVASAPPPQLSGPAEAATAALIAALAEPDRVLVVRVAQAGDYSTYTAQLVLGSFDDSAPAGFDPRLAQLDFTFKAECPSDFDCREQHSCPQEPETPPDIDYVARDYGTFRRLLLDRLSHKVPGWAERSPADEGIALVELLAYVADQLSYRQDAIATEAYLGTARRRVSLRRHAQLVDYEMHDGCNARAFVHLQLAPTAPPLVITKAGTQFLTFCDRTPVAIASASAELSAAMSQHPIVFEPLQEVTLDADHNELHLYTWGDEQCCLPKGATRATLLGAHPNLRANDWLLFEEVLGPRTGVVGDADSTHRQIVQLTRVSISADPLFDPPRAVTEIQWNDADALDFPLCLSSVTDEEHGSQPLADVSVARGNLVLVDHGRTLPHEGLGRMPAPRVLQLANAGAGHCDRAPLREIPARFRPVLKQVPVTQAAQPIMNAGAKQALLSTVTGALPELLLTGTLSGNADQWLVQRSLLNSGPTDLGVVVEVEADGTATLRFGDGLYGRRPATDTEFDAIYRVGNGSAGNIGTDALVHVVGADVSLITQVRNPLPAVNGVDPESAESVRRRAPEAFRIQERALTPADYVEVTERRAGVQRAASRMRWTGSWHTVFVTVDQTGGAALDADARAEMTSYLDRFRMAGHDVAFEEPTHVSLDIALHVCVQPDYFRADVRRALLDLFSNRLLPDGRRGLFHPDNFSFGEPVYLSPLLAAAHRVPGVASVEARRFGRKGDDDPQPLADGRVLLGPREIARLDNDPNFREHGVLTLELHGGK